MEMVDKPGMRVQVCDWYLFLKQKKGEQVVDLYSTFLQFICINFFCWVMSKIVSRVRDLKDMLKNFCLSMETGNSYQCGKNQHFTEAVGKATESSECPSGPPGAKGPPGIDGMDGTDGLVCLHFFA